MVKGLKRRRKKGSDGDEELALMSVERCGGRIEAAEESLSRGCRRPGAVLMSSA